jgi:hypothetical protein
LGKPAINADRSPSPQLPSCCSHVRFMYSSSVNSGPAMTAYGSLTYLNMKYNNNRCL